MASPSTNIKITATDKTQKAFNSVNGNLAGMNKGVNMLKGAFGALAGAMALRAFVNFANQQLKMADTIGKMATKLQISTEALQTFRFAGEQSGETMQTMDNNLIKFAKNLGEAQTGIGLAKRELEILGISLKDSSGNFKSHEQILNEVADAYKNMDNPARKMSSAMALFGRSGHVMVNMLSDGAEGLAKLRQQLVDTGGIIENDFIRDAEDANDAMNRLSKTFGALATKLIADVAPAILDVTETIERLMGIDVTENMSVRRLKSEYERVTEEIKEQEDIIKRTANAWLDITGTSSQLNALAEKELGLLIAEKEELEKQLNLREEATLKAERMKRLQGEQKKNEEKIAQSLSEQQRIQKHATQARFMGATKALGLEQQRNKEHEDLIDLLETEYSSEFQAMEEKKAENIRLQNEQLAEQKRIKKEAMEAEKKAQAILDANAEKNRQNAIRDAEEKERLKRQGLQQTISVAKATGDILYEQGIMGFDAMRALAFTEAMINAHLSATKALASLPPPWSYAVATASYAYASARAYEIKNMKPPAREMGGTVTKGKPFLVGESGAEIFTPGQTGSITPNNAGVTNINFNIRANDASGFDAMLQDRRGMIVSMINQSLHAQGRRGIV